MTALECTIKCFYDALKIPWVHHTYVHLEFIYWPGMKQKSVIFQPRLKLLFMDNSSNSFCTVQKFLNCFAFFCLAPFQIISLCTCLIRIHKEFFHCAVENKCCELICNIYYFYSTQYRENPLQ